ncbi:MAG: ABC transporter ATP-binding protein [Gammaproteobacteria bacterium]|nr:ABC transporter ATP-binding protein [Gammaproteobacteria bacterium]
MKPALLIQDLKKTYHNGVTALHGINLAVQEGDFFALLGPNGAGKSTTIGIVSSIVNKTSGLIKIHDYHLDHQTEKAKALLGVMPQEYNLNIFQKVTQTLLNQASYYGVSRSVALAYSEELLERLGLYDKRNSLVRMLSGGMKRRLMIARALIHRPRILILDEPTAGVDVELRQVLWGFFRELNQQGTTIILTTHYLEEAEMLCRNVAIINKGQIIRDASMDSLLKELEFNTLILDLEQPLDAVPKLSYSAALQSPTQLVVEVARYQSLNALFQELLAADIKVMSVANAQNRLERLFLHLTGDHS